MIRHGRLNRTGLRDRRGPRDGEVDDDSYESFTITCGGGSWQGEVSWELVLDGDTLLTGGAPFSGLLEVGAGGCNLGCTDPAAQNYDASATSDNGSCMYSCTENVFTLNLMQPIYHLLICTLCLLSLISYTMNWLRQTNELHSNES